VEQQENEKEARYENETSQKVMGEREEFEIDSAGRELGDGQLTPRTG
jgi:hypothetical protein